MAYAALPGYRAILISQVTSPGELDLFVPLEEGQPEGSLLMAHLAFQTRPTNFDELVARLNQACWEKGVTPWPENRDIVFADPTEPILYICWQKGFAWWGWILVILLSLALPPLILAALWLLLPESIRQTIEAVMFLMTMGLVMFAMSKMVKGITAPETAK